MPVKCLESGDYVVTIRDPGTVSGWREKTIKRAVYDEVVRHHEQKKVVDREWPKNIEAWQRESDSCFVSKAPNGKTAVILKNRNGLWAGKWRVKGQADEWITQIGEQYSVEEIVEMFYKRLSSEVQTLRVVNLREAQ